MRQRFFANFNRNYSKYLPHFFLFSFILGISTEITCLVEKEAADNFLEKAAMTSDAELMKWHECQGSANGMACREKLSADIEHNWENARWIMIAGLLPIALALSACLYDFHKMTKLKDETVEAEFEEANVAADGGRCRRL